MAKRASFNLTGTIRDFQQSHPGMSAKDAFEAIKKANPGQKVKSSTFSATFYKLRSDGGRKVVRRRKPGHVAGASPAEDVLKAGLHFVRLAGGVAQAKERLAGLEELIEAAKHIE